MHVHPSLILNFTYTPSEFRAIAKRAVATAVRQVTTTETTREEGKKAGRSTGHLEKVHVTFLAEEENEEGGAAFTFPRRTCRRPPPVASQLLLLPLSLSLSHPADRMLELTRRSRAGLGASTWKNQLGHGRHTCKNKHITFLISNNIRRINFPEK